MTYEDLMEKVLAGRSVNATAKALGIPQKTLEGYVKAKSFPGCAMTKRFADVAGVSLEDAVEAVAVRESQVRPRLSFGLPEFGAAAAGVVAVILALVTNLVTPTEAEAAPRFASSPAASQANLYYVKLRSSLRRAAKALLALLLRPATR